MHFLALNVIFRMRMQFMQDHSFRANMRSAYVLFVMICAVKFAASLDNGVGKTPAMGWNSWNYFRCNINETIIRQVADAIAASGLKDAGYTYVNIDDCWMEKRDPTTGRIQPFANKFPSGMKALGDYIHGLGLHFGIYSDTGNKTCEGYPGSWGYEKLDAATYAEWGVDYLKFDYCGMDGVQESVQASYERMRDALAATGRPILFSLCSWGSGQPWLWGKQVGNSWRTGIDVFAAWDAAQARALKLPSFLQPILGAVRQTQALAEYAGPGAFNDPDMLVVGLDGMYPYGIVQECPEHVHDCKPGEYISRDRWGKVGGLTQTEQRTHFSFWCIMAAPLILGNDPRNMSKATLQILLAREVLAVNQDPLGAQGKPVWTAPNDGLIEVWAKPLADGRTAMLLVNLGTNTVDITTEFSRDLPVEHAKWSRETNFTAPKCVDKHELCPSWAKSGECINNAGFMLEKCPHSCPEGCPPPLEPPGPKATALVRDIWLEEDMGVFTGHFTARKVEPHEARFVTLRWMEPADAVAASTSLDFGPRALTNSVSAAAKALKLSLPASEDALRAAREQGAQEQAAKDKEMREKEMREKEVREKEERSSAAEDKLAKKHYVRAKELETEVQKLLNEIKQRDREVSRLKKSLDEVQCSTGGENQQQAAGTGRGDATTARRAALSGDDSGSSSDFSPWLHWTESKVSLALNLAMAVVLSLVLMQPPRRPAKSSRDLQ
ncbi:hypothetical protein Vretimale_18589 [Volvox reticuliferus]|uniref:Alpha-galactosidase n=1 Tax=Volvox reticuliferus TaxID=1737510 RepID=A0A8J4GXN0_9CHLO|nr:hypothetical protein Vretifemale_17053 [Volvox reticuliferus]GIM15936.1 hypothetical protein Vretimale_18589 [Volvox reticuliferus]